MPMAVELFFDAASDSRVREIWAALNSPLMNHGDSRPHISLAAFDEGDTAAVLDKLATLAKRPALTLRLESVAVFPGGEGVVFLAVTPNAALLKLHEECHAALSGLTGAWRDFYLPGHLNFHCTLSMHLRPNQLGKAVEVAICHKLPIEIKTTELGLIKYPPVQHVKSFAMDLR